MSLFNSIFTRLYANSTVSGYVSDRIFDRGFGIIGDVPQLQVTVEENEDPAINQWAATDYSVTVSCVAPKPETTTALSAAVKLLLNRQSWTDSYAAVSSTLLLNSRSQSFPQDGNIEKMYYVDDLEFRFLAQEA